MVISVLFTQLLEKYLNVIQVIPNL